MRVSPDTDFAGDGVYNDILPKNGNAYVIPNNYQASHINHYLTTKNV